MTEAASATATIGQPAAARGSFADWLAVAAGILGTLVAMVDLSIVNASLPVIQGEIGATPSESTWIGTSYFVAEIVVIPLTAWLERMMGLRRMLLVSASTFTLFSVICGLSGDLGMMIFGRVGQGLTGAVLIPISLTIVATRLPRSQQSVGIAVTAMASLLGPIVGPIIGGWLTENYSWHYAFFVNVPVCACQATMIMIAIPKSRGDRREIRHADWFGIAGMMIGLGALTTLLEEGHREQWFESRLIWELAGVSVLGFCLVAVGQVRASRPVIRLSLLRSRTLSSAVCLISVVGVLLYSSLYITPQFLVAVAGYNALQAGEVSLLSGIASVPTAFLYPVLSARLDTRVIVACGILCLAVGAFLISTLTAQSVGDDFTIARILFGIGTTTSMIPLQRTVMASVPARDAAEANSLSAVCRNLGGSIGLAAIAGFQDARLDFHHWRLSAGLGANDPDVQRQIADAAAAFGGGQEGLQAAYQALDGQVALQALVMTFNDMFLALAVIGVVAMPFIFLLRAGKPSDVSAAAGH